MPELPEVETVRRGLAEHVVGRRIADLQITGARVARRHLPGPADLIERTRHTDVVAARRRGKYLWLVLAGPADASDAADGAVGPGTVHANAQPGGQRQALLLHLGMSGQLLVQPVDAPAERHLHARWRFADDGPELRFVDQRTFGGISLAELGPGPVQTAVPAAIAHIAPDPFDPAYERAGVIARLKARDSAIKRGLLDQGIVSGIGNIYADEALWRAGVHGQRRSSTLTRPALGRILDHARDVMTDALAAGGTSFDALYVNVNGASGYFDRSLAAYGQAGRPCRRCGTPIVREHFMNRSSSLCPKCQPAPRKRSSV